MLSTSARLLRLLALLQVRRNWPGPDVADRLGVDVRTVRRDVDRLRTLGYQVRSLSGAGGGYRLDAGAEVPPLLLDDEEAVAVTVALCSAAGGAVAGIEETSLRALGKLQQVLPARLRHRVSALERTVVAIPQRGSVPVPSSTLTAISDAILSSLTLRFDYVAGDQATSSRTVEPHRLVVWGRRWYVVGWDADRADWRTFRVDRMSLSSPHGQPFSPRDEPDGDVVAYLQRTVGSDRWPYQCSMLLRVPAAAVAGRVGGVLTPIDEHSCRLVLATESFPFVALAVLALDVEFEVESPGELADHMRALSERLARAGRRSG